MLRTTRSFLTDVNQSVECHSDFCKEFAWDSIRMVSQQGNEETRNEGR